MEDDRSGALGCGCALPIGLVLGLLAFALVGTLAGAPAPANAAGSGDVTLALSETYLSTALTSFAGASDLAGWEADVLPSNRIALAGTVMVEVLGQQMGLPVRIVVVATVDDGQVRLSLESAQVPGGVEPTAATGLVSPLLAAANEELDARLAASLPPNWHVTGLSSNENEIILHLAEGGAS